MKIAGRILITVILLGVFLLAGLIFLGKENRVVVLPSKKEVVATPVSTPTVLPKELTIPKEKNYTEIFGRDLASQIINQNPEGPILDNEGMALLFNPKRALDEMVKKALQEQVAQTPNFSLKDLNIVPDSKAASQKYVAELQVIANKMIGDWVQDNPMVLLDLGMTTGDYSKLIALIARFEQGIEELKVIAVPQSWAEFHLEVLTIAYQTKSVIPRFLNWQDDPLGTMIALNEYQKISNKTQLLLNEFVQRAKKEGLL